MSNNRRDFLAHFGHDEHIDDILHNSEDRLLKQTAAKNPCISDETMKRMVNLGSMSDKQHIARNPRLHKEHMDKLVDDENSFIRSAVVDNPNLHKEHLDKLVSDDSASNVADTMYHPKLSLEQAKIAHNNLSDRSKVLSLRYKNTVKQVHGYEV